MPKIVSLGMAKPAHQIKQSEAKEFAKHLFQQHYEQIDRLLGLFENTQINQRYLCMPSDWYAQTHSFAEKNDLYQQFAVQLGKEAIHNCLTNLQMLERPIAYEKIEAFIFISSTGIATPTIEAMLMNELPFKETTKRIPIWGLGCAGGAAGISRAYDYCLAHPEAIVLVLAVELCSLTFQVEDLSKSNLVGTSLFADGVVCVCLAGDRVSLPIKQNILPQVVTTQSYLLPHSLDVMGWNLDHNGLKVLFSKDIPHLVKTWVKEKATQFLETGHLTVDDMQHFLLHPGGKKVLDAYQEAFCLRTDDLAAAQHILSNYGNMSSVTVLYVLAEIMMKSDISIGEYGLLVALGPGFSAEFVLLQWLEE